MLYSVVCLAFALLLNSLTLSSRRSVIVPAGLIGGFQAGERKSDTASGHAYASGEMNSCRRFVGEFYAWYVAQGKHGDPLHVALRRKKANFSLALTLRLNEDARAASRNHNEIVGLDFDPVLNSQDFAERYVPGKVTQTGGRFLVEVYSVYSGKRSEVPAVTPELRHEHGRWVFANFLYKNDGKSNDLLSLLKKLKADRNKATK